jgi:hypothetical protein
MAVVSDLKEMLREISEAFPHFLVGETSEQSKDTIRSWVVDVKYDGGDVLLMVPQDKAQNRNNAMSVHDVYRSFVALSAEDHDSVELCPVENSVFRFDIGIVGAHVAEEESALVFWGHDANKQDAAS